MENKHKSSEEAHSEPLQQYRVISSNFLAMDNWLAKPKYTE